ncbi:MAG: sulfatase-like hydrolase/transferase [Verrucomicrobiota bacterium]
MQTPLPALLLAVFVFSASTALSKERPNILWLSAEDIGPHFGCYGDPHAITPHLDALAAKGSRYTHAFTAAGVCAPCRSTIITGMYQTAIGTHHMRCKAALPDFVSPFPMYLREAGYYCTNNSKTDYQFGTPSPKEIWNENSSKAHWKNRDDDQPFFAVFNFTGCHESGIASESKYTKVTDDLAPEQRQSPDTLTTLPPYYPDTPVTREDWKRNYELITAMDAWAGDHLKALEDAGLLDNTIVFFWSDHGVGMPRAKRWLYDSGTRIPLIVHTPGQAPDVDSQMISSVDFGPTVLSLAGVAIPDHMQGRAFLGEAASSPPKYVFGARDRMDERYDIIRAVRGPRFRYIRNFEPLKPYYQYMNTPEKGATMREIRKAEESGELSEVGKLFSATQKPVEEFYDLEEDPHEINNLAGDPTYAEQMAEMRSALRDWQNEAGDLGLLPESEIEIREEAAGSRYQILHREGGIEFLAELTEIATLASSEDSALPQFQAALDHKDAAIRYWAATGLGNSPPKSTPELLQKLTTALEDPAPSVRIAAARALSRMGEESTGVPVLAKELSGSQQWARLQAAIALDELEDLARPALPELQAALKNQPNKYIIRVANKAVNDLQGTSNTVP